jgi:hypothetical protein
VAGFAAQPATRNIHMATIADRSNRAENAFVSFILDHPPIDFKL